jgi:ADP-ribosylation factor-like protein 8
MEQLCQCCTDLANYIKYSLCGSSVKVCVVGPSGSGKTVFCKCFSGGQFDRAPRETAGVKTRKFGREGMNGVFYEVGGSEEFINLTDIYYRKSDVLFFMVDATAPERFDDAKELLRGLLYRNRKLSKPILVLCNKNDMEGAQKCRDIILSIGLDALMDRNVSCYSISSKTGSNFKLVLEWMRKNTP